MGVLGAMGAERCRPHGRRASRWHRQVTPTGDRPSRGGQETKSGLIPELARRGRRAPPLGWAGEALGGVEDAGKKLRCLRPCSGTRFLDRGRTRRRRRSRPAPSEARTRFPLSERWLPHGPRVIALMVCSATFRSAQTRASASKSGPYTGSRSATGLHGASTASNGKTSSARRCWCATVRPWPVTPTKRTSPSSRASSTASSAPPEPSACSHSPGWTRLCSWIRSTEATSIRSSERWMESRAAAARPAPGLRREEERRRDAPRARVAAGPPSPRSSLRCRCG